MRFKFEEILDNLDFSLMILTPDFEIVYANEPTSHLLGLPLGEVLGKKCYELFHGTSHPHPMCPTLNCLRDKKPHLSEFPEKKLGNIWISVSSNPLLDDRGGVRFIIHAVRDVTEVKEREKSLRRSDLFLKVFSAQDIVGIYAMDDKRFHYVNNGFCKIVGRSREEVSSLSPLDLVHPGDRETVKRNIEKRMRGELEEVRYGLRFLRKDGTVRFCEAFSRVVKFEGRPVIFGVIVDRTDKIIAEEKYRKIFEDAPVGIFRTTPSGKVLLANPWFLKALGYDDSTDLSSMDVARDIYYRPEDREVFVKKIEDEGEVKGMELRLKKRDGSPLWVRVYAKAVRDEDGRTLFYEGMVMDVTPRKVLEEQVAQMQKMEAIGRLAGGIAHDFNNILTAIRGYAELLLMSEGGKGEIRKRLESILRLTERGSSLVSKILAFSRSRPLSKAVVDVNKEITDMHEMLKRIIGEDIELKLSLSSNLWKVKADPTTISQVLMNLAANARDAMPEGGTLLIETENVDVSAGKVATNGETFGKSGRYVVIKVSDTGRGIPEEVIGKIFDPFFTTKEEGKGTGLGLSVVYGLVKQHGGFIDVCSEEGVGTTFKVYLPACETGGVDNRVDAGISGDRSFSGKRVLVVDDEQDIREMVEEALSREGFSVASASTAEEALERLKRLGKVHLVIADLTLPGMGAREFFETVVRDNPEIKFLLISGYAVTPHDYGFVSERRIPFLQKPFSIKKLVEEVKKLLSQDS